MSTANDEAEIGRTKLQGDEENGSQHPDEKEEEEEGEEGDEDEPPRSLSGPGPPELEDRHGDEDNLSAENARSRTRSGYGSTLLKNSNIKLSMNAGRPSSADGSLSIPDDTSSLQVMISYRALPTAIDCGNSNPKYHLLAETHALFLIIQVLPRLYALLTVDSRPEVRSFRSNRLELFRRRS